MTTVNAGEEYDPKTMGHPSYAVPIRSRTMETEPERQKRKKKHRPREPKREEKKTKRTKNEEKQTKSSPKHLDPNLFPKEIWIEIFGWVNQEKDRLGVLVTCKDWNRIGRYGMDPSVKDNAFLSWAIDWGRIEIVRELLKDGRVDPGTKNNWALFQAIRRNRTEIAVELLKEPKVDPRIPEENQSWHGHPVFPIEVASRLGRTEIVVKLLNDERVDPTINPDGALYNAILNGHWEVVRELLMDGRIDPVEGGYYALGMNGNWAIKMAVESWHADVIHELLKDSRIDPGAYFNELLLFAIKGHHDGPMKHLLNDIRIDPNIGYPKKPIVLASSLGRLKMVRKLLTLKNVDPGIGDNAAIIEATSNGHVDVLRELLKDKRVDPGARDNEALMRACKYGHVDPAMELLRDRWRRVDPSARHNEAIIKASAGGHVTLVKELLKCDRVNPADQDYAAIKEAARCGYLSVIRILMKDPRVGGRKEEWIFGGAKCCSRDFNVQDCVHRKTIARFMVFNPDFNFSIKDSGMKKLNREEVPLISHVKTMGTCQGAFDGRGLGYKKNWIKCVNPAFNYFDFCGILMEPVQDGKYDRRGPPVMNCDCIKRTFILKGTWTDESTEPIQVMPCSNQTCSSVGCRRCVERYKMEHEGVPWTCPLGCFPPVSDEKKRKRNTDRRYYYFLEEVCENDVDMANTSIGCWETKLEAIEAREILEAEEFAFEDLGYEHRTPYEMSYDIKKSTDRIIPEFEYSEFCVTEGMYVEDLEDFDESAAEHLEVSVERYKEKRKNLGECHGKEEEEKEDHHVFEAKCKKI